MEDLINEKQVLPGFVFDQSPLIKFKQSDSSEDLNDIRL